MTIKVYSDRIEIGAKTITTTPTGIRIGDSLAANTQQQGYIAQANFTARELAFGAGTFQGSVSGYVSGGAPGYTAPSSTIHKFPFASNSNATTAGNLTTGKYRAGSVGQSSSVSGYTTGSAPNGPTFRSNTIEKFPFATDGNGTDVGDLTIVVARISGQSSRTSGYSSGGTVPSPGAYQTNVINKFPFAADTNATDIGNLIAGKYGSAGQSSTTNGYVSGGGTSPGGAVNTIDKFPFATDTNATDVGDLSQSRGFTSGQSSTTNGYSSGGGPTSGVLNTIDKFPFSSDTNATDIGDLSQARQGAAGQSSTTHGYTSGGSTNWPGAYSSAQVNTIDKFSFSTDTNASDVGDLNEAKYHAFGQQS
jgi:hypothetical protein